MKTPVGTEMQTPPVTFTAADLLDYLHPTPGRDMLHVQIVGHDGGRPIDMYLRARDYGGREGRRWHRCDGGFPVDREPTLDSILTEYKWGSVSAAPVLKYQMDPTCLSRWPAVWVACPVRYYQPVFGEPGGRVDRDDLGRVLERLASASEPPHVVVDEGSRIAALWKLDTPFEDREDEPGRMTAIETIARINSPTRNRRGVRLLYKLAHVFAGDIPLAVRPEEMAISLPGQKNDDLYPSHVVTATCRDPLATVSVESLESMAEELSANTKGR